MGANTTVTGNPESSAVPAQGTSQEQAVPQVGMGHEGASDAGAVQTQAPLSADEVRKKFEQDMSRLRSIKDREQAELRKQYEAQIAERQRQLDELAVKNLDEKDRAIYEATRAKQEAETYRQQLAAFTAEQEARAQMVEYAQVFEEQFGIPKAKLDFTNQETLANSAWAAIAEEMQRLKNGTVPPTTPATQTPQSRIVTGSGATPRSNRVTLQDVRAAYEARVGRKLSEEEFWKAAETRRVDLSQVTD
jgi:hypothetical protein